MIEFVIIFGLMGGLLVYVLIQAQRTMPYVYCVAKISAWEARMIPESRLFEFVDAATVSNVLTGLDDTSYRTHLSNVSRGEEIDVVAVERALKEHLREDFGELIDAIPKERKEVIIKFIKRADLYNLKTLVTAIHNRVPKEKRREEMLPSPTLPQERLGLLASAETPEDLLKYLEGTEYFGAFSAALKRYKDRGLQVLLSALDKAYYSSLWEEVVGRRERLPVWKRIRGLKAALERREQRQVLKKIIGYEIDAVNIKLVLRLKKEGALFEDIESMLILPSYELSESTLTWMATAKDIRTAVEGISHTTYGPILAKALPEAEASGSLVSLEKALDEGWLKVCKWMSVAKFFSLAPVLSYIRLKEMEARNLRTIIRLKADKIEPKKIKEVIVRVPKFEL